MTIFNFITFDCEEGKEAELMKLLSEAVSWMKTRKEFERSYHGVYKIWAGSQMEYEMVVTVENWSLLDNLDDQAKAYLRRFCDLTTHRQLISTLGPLPLPQ